MIHDSEALRRRSVQTHDETVQDDWFPLTPMQEAYLVGQTGGYQINIPGIVYLVLDIGDASSEALEDAWNEVIARHSSLRSIFSIERGQRVLESVPRYRVVHFRDEDPTAIKREFARNRSIPSSWPLCQCALSTGAAGRALLHLELNILIADGHSVQIILADLFECYKGRRDRLPRLEYTFRDYCERLAQLKEQNSAERVRGLDTKIAQLMGPPGLPLRYHPSGIDRPILDRVEAKLTADIWLEIKVLAASRNISSNVIFLTSYALSLARFSKHQRFNIGVTIYQRPEWHPQINSIVGDFTGVIALPVDVRGDLSFEQQAEAIQRLLWSELSDYGPDSTIQMLKKSRNRGTSEVSGMPVVFTGFLGQSREAGDWKLVDVYSQTPQVWLDHQVLEQSGAIIFSWDFIKDLWPDGVMEEMFADHCARLKSLTTSSGWKAVVAPAPPSVANSTSTTHPPERTLPIWGEYARTEGVAVIAPSGTISYRQLRARINALERQLWKNGAQRGDRVAIVMNKGWEQVVAVMAIVEAGLVYVPISPDLPLATMHELMQSCETRIALIQPAHSHSSDQLIPAYCRRIVVADDEDPVKVIDHDPPNSNDLAQIIFTSDSAGMFGVAMSHGAVWNTLADVTNRFHVGSSDRVLSLSPLSSNLSVFDIFGMAAAGGAIVVPDGDEVGDPASWALLMERAGVTIWNTMPALLLMIVEYLERNTDKLPTGLRLILLSGDRIPINLPARTRALFPKAEIVSLGGAPGAALWSAAHRLQDMDLSQISALYGKALSGQSIDIYNDNNVVVPDWVTGEIGISGCSLATGYWNDVERTKKAFVSLSNGARIYRTGDLGRRWPDGTIEFLDREDDQIKVNGSRIEPREIEGVLQGLDGISQSYVALRDKQLVAYVVMKQGSSFVESELLSQLRQRLAKHLVPQRIVRILNIPLGESGKMSRSALPIIEEGNTPSIKTQHSELESIVLDLTSQIVGCSRAKLGDDFFQLGGSSIQLIRFHQRVSQRLKIECPLSELIADTQLSEMVRSLEKNMRAERKTTAPSLVIGTPLELPFPMMPLQQAYWVGRRSDIDLGGVAPHGYLEYESPDFDVARAEAAWNVLVQRHPALRTIFTDDAQQRVLQAVPRVEIAVKDLRGLSLERQQQEREAERRRLSHQVFHPDVWPLFEMVATKTDASTRWHISIDLLVGDAWSLRILAREFAELYRSPNTILPPLAVTYRDWVMWRQAMAASPIREESLKYWRAKSQRLPPAPRFPFNAMDVEALPAVARCNHSLPRDAWSKLQSFAAEKRLTAVSLLMTTFCVALREGGAGDKFLLNVTYFDRKEVHPDLSEIVGDFTASLLLPFEWQPGLGLATTAASVHRQLFEVMQHAEVSAVEVIRLAAANKKSITAPVVFTSIIGVPGRADASKIEFPATEVYSISQTPQVWLDCQVSEQDGELLIVWDYRADVVDSKHVRDVFKIFIAKTEALADENQNSDAEDVASPFNELPTGHDKKLYMLMYRDRPALRRQLESGVVLPNSSSSQHPAEGHQSIRTFDLTPMPLAALAAFLCCMGGIADSARFVPKRAYASAGSLYPVQAYLVVRPNSVEGLEQGTYYYNPDEHRLVRTGDAPEFEIPPGFSFGLAIMLIGCMRAIEPIYENRALHFSLIECGLIAQTLENWGRQCGIGTCQVGWEPKFDWRKASRVDSNHQYLHTIVFGTLPPESKHSLALSGKEPAILKANNTKVSSSSVTVPQIAVDKLRTTLFQVLQDVFDGSLRDVDTNLYYIGGDSVRAVRACVKASKELGFEAPLRDLLENPTARGWADALAKRLSKRTQTALAPKKQ